MKNKGLIREVPVHLNKYIIDGLKYELNKKIGWRISNKPDCAQVSELILKKKIGLISESTLYRLFFQFEKHKPYKNTLDIICKFLGYESIVAFSEKLLTRAEEFQRNGIFYDSSNKKSLLFSCIEHTATHPLMDFFEESTDHSHQFKTALGVSIFDSLLISNKQDWFFSNFSHQPIVREFFFEKNLDPRFRIKSFETAYLCYLKGIKPERDIHNLQDYIFGKSVLLRFYVFTNQKYKAIELCKTLYNTALPVETQKKYLHIYPYIRYQAYRLWYLELLHCKISDIENYAEYLIELAEKLKINSTLMEQKILMHTLGECFIHSPINEIYHSKLKQVFADLYNSIHPIIYQKHLKYSLPYFCENGLLDFRP